MSECLDAETRNAKVSGGISRKTVIPRSCFISLSDDSVLCLIFKQYYTYYYYFFYDLKNSKILTFGTQGHAIEKY